MLKHGVITDSLLIGTIIPIPKNKRKSLNDSSNYRGITLSSIMGKILDHVILNKNIDILISSDLQFGFKPKHSTTHCTYVAQEIINYYTNNNNKVYCVLLDASQAFDRVQYVKLFNLLLSKGICPLTARLLALMYTNQKLRIKYGDNISDSFNVSNGVKQGGVLSPILFILYIDELFNRLKKAKIGCYIGNVFAGALGYADDATLLAPTLTSMTDMLAIVTQFGTEYDVKFNPTKTQLIVYGGPDTEHQILFDGTVIKNEKCAGHLGNILGQNTNDILIDKGISSFMSNFNYILSTFHFCTYDIKYLLFQSYCISLYGCVLWDMSSKYITKFLVTWRKFIRRLLKLPYQTHSLYLPYIVNDIPIETQLHKRFLSFFHSIHISNNNILQLCNKLVQNGSGSIACRNLNYIWYKYNISLSKCETDVYNRVKSIINNIDYVYSDNDKFIISHIQDILNMRDNNTCVEFNKMDLQNLLEYFCTADINM